MTAAEQNALLEKAAQAVEETGVCGEAAATRRACAASVRALKVVLQSEPHQPQTLDEWTARFSISDVG